jgi:hypothetical protein
MLDVRLDKPMEIACAVLGLVREVGFDEKVHSDSLAELCIERKVELLHDWASGSVGAKRKAWLDLLSPIGEFVEDCGSDCRGLSISLEWDEFSVHAALEAVLSCVAEKIGLEESL